MEKKLNIVIPAKGISKRCPDKNKILLPFTINWLKENINNTTLLTDSEELLSLGKSLGCKGEIIKETRGEIPTLQEYINRKKVEEWIIMLPLPQPLREFELIDKISTMKIKEDIDFITTYSVVRDRDIFEINQDGKFIKESIERKGSLCKSKMILDGAIYMIKIDWLMKINPDNWNKEFWSGNFDLVENNMPVLDIDTKQDLEKFEQLIKIM